MIGPLRGADDAVRAVATCLELWLPPVLTEIAALPDGPDLVIPIVVDLPATVEAAANLAQYPAVAVASSGLADDPERSGRGTWGASYAVTARFVVRGSGYNDTARQARWYAVAGRTAVLQQLRRGAIPIELVRWTDEDFTLVDPSDARTIGGVDLGFRVTLGDVADERAGPRTLPVDPTVPTPPRPTVSPTNPGVVDVIRKD